MDDLVPPAWKPALPPLRESVRQGNSLGAALAAAPVGFPPLVVGLVQAGEAGSGLAHGRDARGGADGIRRGDAPRRPRRPGVSAHPGRRRAGLAGAAGGLRAAALRDGAGGPGADAAAHRAHGAGRGGRGARGVRPRPVHPARGRGCCGGCGRGRRRAAPAGTRCCWASRWRGASGARRPRGGSARRWARCWRAAFPSPPRCRTPRAPRATRRSRRASWPRASPSWRGTPSPPSLETRGRGHAHERPPHPHGRGDGPPGAHAGPRGAHRKRPRRAEVRSLVRILEPAMIIVFGGVVALVAAALLQAVYSVRPM